MQQRQLSLSGLYYELFPKTKKLDILGFCRWDQKEIKMRKTKKELRSKETKRWEKGKKYLKREENLYNEGKG